MWLSGLLMGLGRSGGCSRGRLGGWLVLWFPACVVGGWGGWLSVLV